MFRSTDRPPAQRSRPVQGATAGSIAGVAVLGAVAAAAAGLLFAFGGDHPRLFARKVAAVDTRYGPERPRGAILLTGSSFFERWTSSAADLAPLQTVNVGIGGTKIGDQAFYLDRLVVPFAPRTLVVYAGSNDISGLPFVSKKAADVVGRIRRYVADVRDRLPGISIYYVAITETPSRARVRGEIRRANRMLQEWAERSGEITFIDTAPSLLTATGQIDGSLFGPDRLHFNAAGYARFAPPIRAALMRDLALDR
ncbi:hypothetical protein GCM10022240_26720 [Microbacterium kribbense]|uniref:SGNH hydrolase-type esterase domain-containing protein n=1 Tax=Microbacterium kribbense TaxID=433645 RepID=A0ABP7GU67_9MICO